MKLKTNDPNSNSLGIEGAKEFTIDTSNQMIVSILRDKLYSNKIGAVCREVASNSRDANREAGRGDTPIKISIYKEESVVDEIQTFISFQDSGVGISPERIENVFLKYGSSTKRNSNTQTGGFGIGAKTPFAYNNEFLIETVSEDENGNKLKCVYQAIIMNEKGFETSSLIPISQEETTENTGTKIVVPIKERDIYEFEKESLKATMFWSTRPVYEGFVNFKNVEVTTEVSNDNWKIFKGDYKNILDVSSYELFLLVDEIPYKFDYRKINSNEFGVAKSFIVNVSTSTWNDVYINMAVSFKTGELSLSASREEIEYTESNILKIQDEIKKVEGDLTQKVKDIIEEKETLIEKAFFLNSFRSSESSDSLGKYLKIIDLFEKIKREYDIHYTTNDILKKHTTVTLIGSAKVELYEFSEYCSAIRLRKKTKRELTITLKKEELNNSIIVFKEKNFRMDSQINRTLVNLNKKVFIFVYDNFFNTFDKNGFKNELAELFKPIDVDVLEYSEIEKTKPEKSTYNYGDRPKQDKNVKTIYARYFSLGNIYKDSHKYNVLEKKINDNIDNLIILPIINVNSDLKDLDKKNVILSSHIKKFNVEYLKEVNIKDILSFVNKLGYKVIIVKSESDFQKIKNTPHTTVEKVFEDLLKDPKVIEEFNKQIEQEYISGAGMIKFNNEEHLKINSQVYKMALSLVGFDINNYKIFKTENEKLEAVEEEVTKVISLIKNNYSFREVKNAIKNHIRDKQNNNKFEGFLSQEIVESFKEKLKQNYPIFHHALNEINSYFGCENYNVLDEEGNVIEEGKKIWEKQLLDLLKLEIKNKNQKGELIVTKTTKGRGRPKGSKNKVKII